LSFIYKVVHFELNLNRLFEFCLSQVLRQHDIDITCYIIC